MSLEFEEAKPVLAQQVATQVAGMFTSEWALWPALLSLAATSRKKPSPCVNTCVILPLRIVKNTQWRAL